MAGKVMQVELVAADRLVWAGAAPTVIARPTEGGVGGRRAAAGRVVWSGGARMVIARTTEGDVGILPDHSPMLSLMVDGVVDVTTSEGETWVAAAAAGVLSVPATPRPTPSA